MNKTVIKALTAIVLSMLAISMLAGLNPAYAVPAQLDIINPGPDGYPAKWTAGPATVVGTNSFVFTTGSGTHAGNNFFINLTVTAVTALYGWGVGLLYDTSVLQYVSAWRPSDHVFAVPEFTFGWTIVAPAPVIEAVNATHNIIKWGCTYVMGTPEWSFNGTGVIGEIQFKILQEPTIANPIIRATFAFDPAWTAWYYWPTGQDVPMMGTATFEHDWTSPTALPHFYVKPAIYKDDTAKLGDDVAIEVWVENVDQGWSIIAFQFSLWFNTSFLADTTYEAGSWINAFAEGNESIVYAATHDYHGIDPGLPYCYNKWFAFVAILPDPNPDVNWTAPFPSGSGMLFRFHHTAALETIFPLEAWTTLELHDVKVYNAFGMSIFTDASTNGLYRAPIKKLGRSIDVHTQYPAPYGGQGPANPSDMFAPQAEVCLFATVTYNEDPVQMKLVAFEIRHGEYDIFREAYTDENGTATICFRIPWPCVDPAGRVLGMWQVTSTVDIAEGVVNDTLSFMVWWPVEIVSVVPKATEYIKNKTGTMPNMEFTVTYRTLSMQTIPLLLTTEVYDELGFHIGSAFYQTTVGWGTYHTPIDEFLNYTHDFSIPMPTNAAVGTATVYADAYNDFPWFGGVPYCPEASNTFFIKKGP